MKKITKGIIGGALACVMACAFAAAGCGPKTYTITFDYNYTGAPAAMTQKVEDGALAAKPADPTRSGYTFDNWYTTSACTAAVDFTAAIHADATYYAGWSEAVTTYTVTAVVNGVSTQYTVKDGGTLSIETPTAEGKVFSGWFTDEDCTKAYDLSSPVTSNVTIYAGWLDFELKEGYVAIYYMMNDGSGSVYTVEQVKKDGRVLSTPAAPSRANYEFKNWYLEPECVNSFNSASYGKVSDTLYLYAAWNTTYTFEAEYTNLYNSEDEPRHFYGYSNDYFGEKAVLDGSEVDASNGYYVAGTYDNGQYIYFDIYSSKTVMDAQLTLRCSCEGGWFTVPLVFTPDNYTILVNGTALTSFQISLDNSKLELGSGSMLNFADCYISNITLKEGWNTIRFENNSDTKGQGGTLYCESPLLDCIKITTDATLTWNPVLSNVK